MKGHTLKVCEYCNRQYLANGPQRWCSPRCKQVQHNEALKIGQWRRAKPLTRYCLGCNKPLHPNNKEMFCSAICETIASVMGG